jgi:hypothetical protein
MLRAITICCLSLLTVAGPASAEWHISPMIGLTLRGSTNINLITDAPSKTHLNVGGVVSLLGGGILGVEAVGVFTPVFKGDDPQSLIQTSRMFALMGNVVVTTPRRWTEYSLRPFVSAGYGAIHVSVVDAISFLPLHSNVGAFNVGGGAVGFLSKRTGVRFDLRYFSTPNRAHIITPPLAPVHLSYMTLSAGVVFRLRPPA